MLLIVEYCHFIAVTFKMSLIVCVFCMNYVYYFLFVKWLRMVKAAAGTLIVTICDKAKVHYCKLFYEFHIHIVYFCLYMCNKVYM